MVKIDLLPSQHSIKMEDLTPEHILDSRREAIEAIAETIEAAQQSFGHTTPSVVALGLLGQTVAHWINDGMLVIQAAYMLHEARDRDMIRPPGVPASVPDDQREYVQELIDKLNDGSEQIEEIILEHAIFGADLGDFQVDSPWGVLTSGSDWEPEDWGDVEEGSHIVLAGPTGIDFSETDVADIFKIDAMNRLMRQLSDSTQTIN